MHSQTRKKLDDIKHMQIEPKIREIQLNLLSWKTTVFPREILAKDLKYKKLGFSSKNNVNKKYKQGS